MVTDISFENISWFDHQLDENSTQVRIDGNTRNIEFIEWKKELDEFNLSGFRK
jgi:hypothetical protein